MPEKGFGIAGLGPQGEHGFGGPGGTLALGKLGKDALIGRTRAEVIAQRGGDVPFQPQAIFRGGGGAEFFGREPGAGVGGRTCLCGGPGGGQEEPGFTQRLGAELSGVCRGGGKILRTVGQTEGQRPGGGVPILRGGIGQQGVAEGQCLLGLAFLPKPIGQPQPGKGRIVPALVGEQTVKRGGVLPAAQGFVANAQTVGRRIAQ